MGKLISVKEGNKTRYMTQEAYERYIREKEERKNSVGDITCSGATSIGMGFTDKQWNRIFGRKVEES